MPDKAHSTDPKNAIRKSIAEGEAILRQAHEDYGLEERTSDGPLTKAWNRGGFPRKKPLDVDEPALDGSKTMREAIAYAIDRVKSGQWIAASMALAMIRKRFEAQATDLSWEDFKREHLAAIPSDRIEELIGRMVHHGGMLRCTRCGRETKCVCGCGAPYLSEHPWRSPVNPASELSALERAKAAITADDRKSDRAIAKEIGVGNKTVSRARQLIAEASGHDTVDDTVERTGLDGRTRRLPTKRQTDFRPVDPAELELSVEPHPDNKTPQQQWEWSLGYWAAFAIATPGALKAFPDWEQYESSDQLVTLAEQAEQTWRELKRHLIERRPSK